MRTSITIGSSSGEQNSLKGIVNQNKEIMKKHKGNERGEEGREETLPSSLTGCTKKDTKREKRGFERGGG
jgi:hypothetical protein